MPRTTKRSTKTGRASSAKTKAKAKAPKKIARKRILPEVKKAIAQQRSTSEQLAQVNKAANSFEGAKRIDHLPLNEQIDQVFNPLHTITKTNLSESATQSTFIVQPAEKSK